MRRRHLQVVMIVIALTGLLASAPAVPASEQAYPRCFGAASRDPAVPCDNPQLHFRVIPSPTFAPILPNSPCTPVRSKLPPNVCWFGHAVRGAAANVALVGDSHASAWRSAVAVAARARRWHGLTLRRSSCAFTLATRAAAAAQQQACRQWVRDAIAWFARHPEVTTVFVAADSHAGVVAPEGQDPYTTAVAGFRAAFDALPASVTRVEVLRDNPRATTATLPCVAGAAARHRRAEKRCGLPRGAALLPDAAATAARQTASTRVQVIDLTDFFCDAAVCPPVIGGALVFKDISHLTDTFSATLGPYLLARYEHPEAPTAPN